LKAWPSPVPLIPYRAGSFTLSFIRERRPDIPGENPAVWRRLPAIAAESQHSLFGAAQGENMPEPVVPKVEPMDTLHRLKLERDLLGFYISGHPLDHYKFELRHFCPNKIEDLKVPDKVKGRDLTVGGMISSVNHRISKNGKPFGTLVLEDFDGSIDITLFGEDYVRLKSHLVEGYFVYLKGKMQERYYQKDELEFKVSTLGLLSDLRDKMLKGITLSMALGDLNKDSISRLSELIRENTSQAKGNCTLTLKIMDSSENLSLEMPSRKFKVSPDNALIENLEKMAELQFN
jgi:DNA polymerase-3 subunit alpha